jgi:hypothetical protein
MELAITVGASKAPEDKPGRLTIIHSEHELTP